MSGKKEQCNDRCNQIEKRGSRTYAKAQYKLVGTTRFELATSRTPSERATRLRYVPKYRIVRLVLPLGIVKFDGFLLDSRTL